MHVSNEPHVLIDKATGDLNCQLHSSMAHCYQTVWSMSGYHVYKVTNTQQIEEFQKGWKNKNLRQNKFKFKSILSNNLHTHSIDNKPVA